ncbi:MAG: hypothetical protein L0Z50_29955 [Verrucomicrobiales bacterium]|nr:hypothetical protein [Verrucomicrobiales bacterium]
MLYLLDGDAHFHSASGVVQSMGAGIAGNIQIPELLVVAIPNTSFANRTRDLTPTHSKLGPDGKECEFFPTSGGGDKFLKFLKDELTPRIESSYRTLPFRVFVGHSFGGLLVLHALLGDSPEMFQAYIAIDPSVWWDNQVLVRSVEGRPKNSRKATGSVYVSLANNPDQANAEATRRLAQGLKTAFLSELRSTLQFFEAEDHGSVPLLSLYRGLLFAFEGYKPRFEDSQKPSALADHVRKVSERFGIQLPPPESFVNGLGQDSLLFKDADKAIEFFKLNVTNFPGSFNAYNSLAEAYQAKGEKALAIENYERTLKLRSRLGVS